MSKINVKDLEVNVKNQTQMVIEHFKNFPPKKLTNPIFNEDNPTQEKKF